MLYPYNMPLVLSKLRDSVFLNKLGSKAAEIIVFAVLLFCDSPCVTDISVQKDIRKTAKHTPG